MLSMNKQDGKVKAMDRRQKVPSALNNLNADILPCQSDSLARANEVKKDQGLYENEVSLGGEADLHKQFDSCSKNKGHEAFIPAWKFNAKHLPLKYRNDTDLVQLILALISMTVRLTVKYVSTKRPEVVPGTNVSYPFTNRKGSTCMRFGTGSVFKVFRFSGRDCPCFTCQQSGRPKQKWGRIMLLTAAHLIYDNDEGKHASCHFDFDSNSISLDKCPSLSGAIDVDGDVKMDWSSPVFVTHDVSLLDESERRLEQYHGLCRKLRDKYMPEVAKPSKGVKEKRCQICRGGLKHWQVRKNNLEMDEDYEDRLAFFCEMCEIWTKRIEAAENEETGVGLDFKDDAPSADPPVLYDANYSLTIIVSHPHGCKKMVTIGDATQRWEENNGIEADVSYYAYTTPTCTGSSGAPVFILGRWWRLPCDHPHSGVFQGERNPHIQNQQLNRCGAGRDCSVLI